MAALCIVGAAALQMARRVIRLARSQGESHCGGCSNCARDARATDAREVVPLSAWNSDLRRDAR
jgi:hypothetical protein